MHTINSCSDMCLGTSSCSLIPSMGTNTASLFGCKKYAKQYLSLCPCSGWDTVLDVTRCHVDFSLPAVQNSIISPMFTRAISLKTGASVHTSSGDKVGEV